MPIINSVFFSNASDCTFEVMFDSLSESPCCNAFIAVHAGSRNSPAQPSSETRYLLSQVFTGAPDPRTPPGDKPALDLPGPSTSAIRDVLVQDMVSRIGTVGSSNARLGFAIGPLAFDHYYPLRARRKWRGPQQQFARRAAEHSRDSSLTGAWACSS